MCRAVKTKDVTEKMTLHKELRGRGSEPCGHPGGEHARLREQPLKGPQVGVWRATAGMEEGREE